MRNKYIREQIAKWLYVEESFLREQTDRFENAVFSHKHIAFHLKHPKDYLAWSVWQSVFTELGIVFPYAPNEKIDRRFVPRDVMIYAILPWLGVHPPHGDSDDPANLVNLAQGIADELWDRYGGDGD